MLSNTKFYVFISVFSVLLVAFFLISLAFPDSAFSNLANIVESGPISFILLMMIFMGVAFGATFLFQFCCCMRFRIRMFRPSVGSILKCQGMVSQEDLDTALVEQRRRMGEVLVEAGRITQAQLDDALDHQKKVDRRLGEILMEQGYLNDGDIEWAVRKTERRLGEILEEKGVLSEMDLHWALRFQRMGPDWIKNP